MKAAQRNEVTSVVRAAATAWLWVSRGARLISYEVGMTPSLECLTTPSDGKFIADVVGVSTKDTAVVVDVVEVKSCLADYRQDKTPSLDAWGPTFEEWCRHRRATGSGPMRVPGSNPHIPKFWQGAWSTFHMWLAVPRGMEVAVAQEIGGWWGILTVDVGAFVDAGPKPRFSRENPTDAPPVAVYRRPNVSAPKGIGVRAVSYRGHEGRRPVLDHRRFERLAVETRWLEDPHDVTSPQQAWRMWGIPTTYLWQPEVIAVGARSIVSRLPEMSASGGRAAEIEKLTHRILAHCL